MVTKCERCGRKLKNPRFVEIGYGRVCAQKSGIVIPLKERTSRRRPKEITLPPTVQLPQIDGQVGLEDLLEAIHG